MKRLQAFFLMIAVLVVSGCSDSSAPLDENLHDGLGSNLLDVAWELIQYTTSSGSLSAVDEATKYQFLFDSESTNVEVFIGCVNYSGNTYDKRDGFLLIELGPRYAVVCNTETEEFAEQTNTIMNLLQGESGGHASPYSYNANEIQ